MGANTTLDIVEDRDFEDWEGKKDESDSDCEKGNEADNLEGKDSVVCVTSRDHSDGKDADDRACVIATLIFAYSSDFARLIIAAFSSEFSK